jgi:NAD(P)-dependent dehydrogenase (short-subunit alcohol dehydrogenase family)
MRGIYKIFSLEGKKALVTGAANGNGRAISKALADAGCQLVLIDSDHENLANVSSEIKEENDSVVKSITLDISDPSGLEAFLKKHNEFDIVINNAGITRGNHLFDYKNEDWDMTYKVNLLAPYKIIKKVSQSMCEKNSGSIINITSLAAEVGFPGNPAYVAFKGALKQLTKAVACDLSNNHVRINSIGPGYIKTNMTAKSWDDKKMNLARTDRTTLGRWGESSDLVGAVIFLASDASSYITGQDFYIDGGWLAKGL